MRSNEGNSSPLATFVTVNQTQDGEREIVSSEYQTIEKGSSKAAGAADKLLTDLKIVDPDIKRDGTRNPDPTLRTNVQPQLQSPSELFSVPVTRPYSAKQGVPTVKPMLVQHNQQAGSINALAPAQKKAGMSQSRFTSIQQSAGCLG